MKLFKLKAIAIGALSVVLTLGALSAEAQTFKLTHQWKEGVDARDKAARLFVEEVNKSLPDLKVRIYPGSSLISHPKAQYDALLQGTIEMSVFPLIYGSGKVPEFSGTILPGAVNSLNDAEKLKHSVYHEQLQKIAEANGIHILTWWWTEGGFATSASPVTSPDTVAGTKLRGSDKAVDNMLLAAGASVFSMPSTEIYSALQTGVLDGAMTSFESFQSMRIFEQTKYATLGGDYSVFMLLQPLVISMSAWEGLTDEQQAVFEKAAEISDMFFKEQQEQAGQKTIEAFEKAGVEVRQMTEEEHKEWVDLAKRSSWVEFAKISPDANALIEALEASK
ncbi:TRAP-type C4-dicarboxylate transport system, substrate-binding protein [Roseovarius pacificus]|uniref:TRAP-type C4-dicarboxylate transport system, substrate-binding protein n=1 Tax=Roseovarius pacificus TaxID=337701 RepID=A0A1M7II95_9RHOB|nr:TRAP transporter substrate-binding protein DctP [Roseovarius pacificus]GGO61076.1 ABC transporter substrate-binding protein [Roseovarius pacificus]SHM40512.1 TRAP-type C4-dicarboxylate transport system, substrate-binding protein [Roseovarius pacificus]